MGPEITVGGGGGPENIFVINISHRGPNGPPSRSNWTKGVQLLLEGSVPVFLRKHIATCDFQGGPRPLYPRPSGSSHEKCKHNGLMFKNLSLLLLPEWEIIL